MDGFFPGCNIVGGFGKVGAGKICAGGLQSEALVWTPSVECNAAIRCAVAIIVFKRKLRVVKVVLSGILFLLSAVLVNASVVFSDAFNYLDGALTNDAPAVWLEHGSGVPLQVNGGQAQVSGGH